MSTAWKLSMQGITKKRPGPCTAQYSKVQYSTVQYCTVQYSTVQTTERQQARLPPTVVPPRFSLPSRKITALSYSWTTFKYFRMVTFS